MKPYILIKQIIFLSCVSSALADDIYKEPLITQNVNHKDLRNSTYSDCSAIAIGTSNGQYDKYESLEFRENSAYAFAYTTYANTFYAYDATAYAEGGALKSGNLNITNCKKVTLDSNYAYAFARSESPDMHHYKNEYSYYGSYACGGAIHTLGSLNITNNESVEFSHNRVEAYDASGGAIYSEGAVSIVNNGSVIFSQNYEYDERGYGSSIKANPGVRSGSGTVLLRSLYIKPNSESDILTLSARTNGHITFYDSVYMGNYANAEVRLNSDYQDKEGVTQKATGDIVFSGKYTADHLKEIKGGTAGTATEIANSRTSELLNTVNLYGGTLRVEDKAVLKTHAINVTNGSNATMRITDAEVNASGYDITVNKTGTLEIGGTDGSTKVTANNINIEEGATLSFTRTEVATENVAITLAAADSISIHNDKIAGIVSSSNLNIAGGATLKADGAHLSMDGGILSFLATTENKTNLVLTLGAEYSPNSQIILFSDVDTVKFLQDNITATSTGAMVTLNAADYFTGDWINDKTTLVYDSGNVYVSGVNVVIPEPTSATLSLLALVGFAARRRRK